MAFSVERILSDAQRLSSRLKEHDATADNVLIRTQVLEQQIKAMKQFQDSLNELNASARHRPRTNLILGLAEENSRIRDLQAENKELRQSLEEHQSALELIMTKYREQMTKLHRVYLMNQTVDAEASNRSQEMNDARLDKIAEMAAVMQKALEFDGCLRSDNLETISRLKDENDSMRRMLNISSDLMLEQTASVSCEDKVTQTDEGQSGNTAKQKTPLKEDLDQYSSSTDSLVTILEHLNNRVKT